MKQYFTDDVKLVDNPKELSYEVAGEKLRFKTNSGLFAKDNIDEYSSILLNNIEIKKYDNILDLGCGYGFIGIALSKICDYNKIDFIDITQRACDYTRINCELNNVINTKIIKSDGIKNEDKYDLITLNPPIHAGKETMYRLYNDAIEHLNINGELYIVLHKNHGAKSTIKYFESMNANILVIYKKKSLYILKIKSR